MVALMASFIDEFLWARVDRTNADGCWEWRGNRNGAGYGLVSIRYGRAHRAHRVAWELIMGPIPDDMVICHRCDNPPCVRPEHLFLGTKKDNTQDMLRKERDRARGERQVNSVLTNADVVSMREQYASGDVSQQELIARFGVSAGQVSEVLRGLAWAHAPGPISAKRTTPRKLSDEQVEYIRRSVANGVMQKDFCELYGVSPSHISSIVRHVRRAS